MNTPNPPYPRFFNTAGPVRPEIHYCLSPLERLDLPQILRLIQQEKYFVLHTPRQVGKTSFLLALTQYLNQNEQYTCLYVNVEAAQTAREDVSRGIHTILSQLGREAQYHLHDDFLAQTWPAILAAHGADAALNELLSQWAIHSGRPVILLIDEIDSLVGDTLISVLRQLRAGYPRRPTAFPQSIILCGVRDVRDYRIYSSQGREPITGGSAFNIKAESLRMGDFTQAEMEALYRQHTEVTGQQFVPETIPIDDIMYARDLGLIRGGRGQHLTIANPIYQEVIPRELTYSTQVTITHETVWYVAEDGRLDLNKLLAAFQQFFREHSVPTTATSSSSTGGRR